MTIQERLKKQMLDGNIVSIYLNDGDYYTLLNGKVDKNNAIDFNISHIDLGKGSITFYTKNFNNDDIEIGEIDYDEIDYIEYWDEDTLESQE